MLTHTIAFSYSKKNEVIANNFIPIFNQFNLNTLTPRDLEQKSLELEDQLSLLYHLDTFVILLSKNDENNIQLLWEFFYIKYIHEKNITLIPILLEDSTNLDIPNSIKTIQFENNYIECVKTTKSLLDKQKSTPNELKLDLHLFLPMVLNDLQLFGSANNH